MILFYFQTHQSKRLYTFTLSKKRAFYSFCIEFALLFIWNHCICNAFEDTHVYNARPCVTLRFFVCNRAQGLCQTSV